MSFPKPSEPLPFPPSPPASSSPPALVPGMPRSARALLTLLVLLLAPWGLEGQTVPDLPAVLRPGDLVHIQVWRQEAFSGEFRVTPDGTVAHPLLQAVQVADRDLDEVRTDVARFLAFYIEEPSVVVEALVLISVGGQVRLPNVYPLTLDTSVARAVATAGGATEAGDLTRVLLRRAGVEVEIDLTDPRLRLRDLEVRSGDEIVVERRRSIFRDYVVPWASVGGAAATILRLFW